MADVTKEELQDTLTGLIKYINKNRNHLALDLYRQMHRADVLGHYGRIYCHNSEYDVEIKLTRKTRGKK